MTRRAAAVAIAALLVLACTLDTAVLVPSPDAGGAASGADCAAAFAAGAGARCAGSFACTRPSSASPSCCVELLFCSNDTLVAADDRCTPGCGSCESDADCEPGLALCADRRCQDCPSAGCPPCPVGMAPLLRNGCETCFCAPPSDCPDGTACPEGETCYPGSTCAPGCSPGDPGCCANVCASADPACPGAAPLGCDMPCDPATECRICVAMACECTGGRWICRPGCAPFPNGECAVR